MGELGFTIIVQVALCILYAIYEVKVANSLSLANFSLLWHTYPLGISFWAQRNTFRNNNFIRCR